MKPTDETAEYQRHLEELAAAYAVGALDEGGERTYFEDLLLAQDPEALGHLARMFESAGVLARVVPQQEAPATALESLMKKVRHVPKHPASVDPLLSKKRSQLEDKSELPKQQRAYVPIKTKPWIIGGGAFVLIVIISLTVRLLNLRSPDAEVIAVLEETQAERDSLKMVLAERQTKDSLLQAARKLLQDPAAQSVALRRPNDKAVVSTLYWSPNGQRLLWFTRDVVGATTGSHLHLWQRVGARKLPLGSLPGEHPGGYYLLQTHPGPLNGFEITAQGGSSPSAPHTTLLVGEVTPAFDN